MSHNRPCHTSRFGLRHDRSTFDVNASNHSTRAASSAAGSHVAGVKSADPGRKSMPRFDPALARTSSCTSWSGSPRAITGSTSTRTSAGTGNPSRRASSPTTTSATSTLGPCPALRNFTT
jgi:hypothetical protein